jgi:hypothetical protein
VGRSGGMLDKAANEELHNLYPSPNVVRAIKSKRMKWAVHEALTVEINAYKILVGKREGKKPLGRPRRRWKYIIMALK